LYYLEDAVKASLVGGDFTMYKKLSHFEEINNTNSEKRFPLANSIALDRSYRPKDNLAIVFASTSESIHGVSRITVAEGKRQFIYLSISAEAQVVW
jgi:hypothetical protein